MVFQTGESLHRKLTASFLNGLAEMHRQWQTNGRQLGGGPVSMPSSTVVWVKNTTSTKVDAFGVLALSAPIIDLSTVTHEKFNGIRFDGIAPSTSTPHYGKYAVLQEPAAKDGGFARAVIAGQTLCRLTINDADDVAADIANNSTAGLTSSMHGSARILWKESGTGSGKMALVDIGNWANLMLGKTDSTHNKGADGTVSIWAGALGSEVDTGVNVTARNQFANVGSTKWVVVASIGGRLYIIAAEC